MRILINRTDAIGDTLLTLPMVKYLKEKFPEAQIALLVSPRCGELMDLVEEMDEYYVYDPKWSFPKRWEFLSKVFKNFNPNHYLFVGGKHLPTFYAWLKRVSFRGGLVSKWASFLFLNRGIRQSRSIVTMHESEYNIGLLEPLLLDFPAFERDRYQVKLRPKDDQVIKAMSGLNEELKVNGHDAKKPFVVIHPGMTGHTLNWSSRNYGRLIRRFEKEYGERFNYIISHTPGDSRFLEGVHAFLNEEEQRRLKKRVLFFDGSQKGINNFTSILSRASLFIGPSTGTTHMANALGVKLVGIYSPIKVQSAMRWGPLVRDEKVKVIVPDVVCGEQVYCAKSDCPYYECMAKIEVEDVFLAAKELLESTEE